MIDYNAFLQAVKDCQDIETLRKVALDAIENGKLDSEEIDNIYLSHLEK